MADLYTQYSIAVAGIPFAVAQQAVDFIKSCEAHEDGDDGAPSGPDGWPDPEAAVNDGVGEINVELVERLEDASGTTTVHFFATQSGNVDFLILVLEQIWENAGFVDAFAFSYSFSCSKPRLDEFGGGTVVIGRNAAGNVVSDYITTSELERRLPALVPDITAETSSISVCLT